MKPYHPATTEAIQKDSGSVQAYTRYLSMHVTQYKICVHVSVQKKVTLIIQQRNAYWNKSYTLFVTFLPSQKPQKNIFI